MKKRIRGSFCSSFIATVIGRAKIDKVAAVRAAKPEAEVAVA